MGTFGGKSIAMKQVAVWNSSSFVAPTYLSFYGDRDLNKKLISCGCL
jgi:hypothetical protein